MGQKKGFKHSEETKRKIGIKAMGRKHPLSIIRFSKLNKGKIGKDHPKWTENKKRPFYKSIRQLHQYTEWRKSIFTRDNFKCTQCGSIGYIEADHYPRRFIDIIRENQIKTIDEAINCLALWDINNGRTLCLLCHRKTDTWGRKKD